MAKVFAEILDEFRIDKKVRISWNIPAIERSDTSHRYWV
jgi:hypothetical protein